jgi:prepilin-type processing-associated H-X9-DG protein
VNDRFWTRLLALLGCAVVALFYLHARAQTTGTACPDNARLVYQAVLNYVQDYDETLPRFDLHSDITAELSSYLPSPLDCACPVTHTYYLFNRKLSGVTMAAIANPSTIELLRDALPHPDGKSTIVYMDGYLTYGGVDPTPEADCARFAGRLALGVEVYALDYDQIMPPMQDPRTFRNVLWPYIRDSRGFNCPVTGLAFTPNAALSGLMYGNFPDLGTTEVVRDAQPHPDGDVTIAYMDGVVTQGGVDTQPDADCAKFIKVFADVCVGIAYQNGGVFPNIQNNAAFQAANLQGTHDSRVFTCPATELPYAFNSSLVGVDYTKLPDEGTVVVAQDAQPHANGKSTLAYLDGHVTQGGVAQPNTRVACDDNLEEMARGMTLYAQDHNETLPPMHSFAQFRAAIYPYVHSSWKFSCPDTNLNYVINPSLSGVSLSTITSPSTVPFIRDARPHADGTKAFGYVDGHVKRFPK